MVSECVSPSVDDLAQPHLADLASQAETVGVHRSFVTVAACALVDIIIYFIYLTDDYRTADTCS